LQIDFGRGSIGRGSILDAVFRAGELLLGAQKGEQDDVADRPLPREQHGEAVDADAEIILQRRDDTLRIPTEAVLEGNRVFVYLPEHKVIREHTFKSGISNWYYTEVISGLKPDQQVVVNVDRAGIKDGAKAVLSQEAP